MIELSMSFILILALVAVFNPKKKVSKDKYDLDFTEQDKINKEVNI